MRYFVTTLMLLFLTGCVTYSDTYAHDPYYSDRVGRVVSVEAIGRDVYRNGAPTLVRECTPTRTIHGRTSGGTIIGAIAGAALGNRIGGGSGRDIATAAGAVIGGSIGSDYDRPRTHTSQRCYYTQRYSARVHHVVDYYSVRIHDDRGQEFKIRMNHPPPVGSYINF